MSGCRPSELVFKPLPDRPASDLVLRIRPVLKQYQCTSCHGNMAQMGDAEWMESGFLDTSDWKKSAILLRVRRNADTKTLVPTRSGYKENMPTTGETWQSADYFKLADWAKAMVEKPPPSPSPTPSGSPAVVTYAQFRQVLANRCFTCHDNSDAGNFAALDENGWLLSSYLVAGQPDDSKIYYYLQGSDAPIGPKNMPKGGGAIPLADREKIKNYILSLKGKTATCGNTSPHYARAALLNPREFNYAIEDILGLPGDHSSFFPDRPPDSMGYDNKGGPFPYNPVFAEKLYDKIEWLVDAAISSQSQLPGLFKCGIADFNTATCRDTLISALGRKAFRRPLTATEKSAIVAVSDTQSSAINKLKAAYIRILMSPEFLFKLEPDNGATAIRDLNHFEIASRLSFLIWSSVPDLTLLDLAAQGKLRDPATLRAQVTRMMADKKGNRFVDAFTEQWLLLGDFSSVQPNSTEFPGFPSTLKQSMFKETQAFLRDVIRNRPVSELLTAEYSYLNDELSGFYGIQVQGATSAFTKVTLPQSSRRRGFLSQGTTLMMTFRGQQHRPVLRGNYVLGQILCDVPVGTVPDNATNPDAKLPANPTFKQILAAHRDNPDCAGCHMAMDPVGLAFDHFDGVGRFRTTYGPAYSNLAVDTTESLYGKAFQSSYDMMDILAASDKYYRCVAKNAYAYSVKVPETNDEKCEVQSMATELQQKNLTLVDFIRNVVVKDQFIKRKPE